MVLIALVVNAFGLGEGQDEMLDYLLGVVDGISIILLQQKCKGVKVLFGQSQMRRNQQLSRQALLPRATARSRPYLVAPRCFRDLDVWSRGALPGRDFVS